MTSNRRKAIISDIYDIDFKMQPKLDISSKETFGIEIEFENVNLETIRNIGKWALKVDDTVTYYDKTKAIGGELVSPIFVNNEENWIDINKKCNMLIKKDAVVTQKTGSHVHIGSQILEDNPDNIRRLLKQWELFENIIYYFSYGMDSRHRVKIDSFAAPIGKKLYYIRNSKKGYSQFKHCRDWLQFFNKQQFNKHCGINFRNYKGFETDDKNTIEIRCANGTLNPTIWQNNINTFMKFMMSCREENCDEEQIDYLLDQKDYIDYNLNSFLLLDIDKAILFSDMMFDRDIDKLMFLKQYLKITEKEKQYTKK